MDYFDIFLEKKMNENIDLAYNRYVKKCKKNKKKPLSKYEWKKRNGLLTIGAAGALTALGGGKKVKSMISGREKVYHGVRNLNYDEKTGQFYFNDKINSIRKQGLRKDKGGTGISLMDRIAAQNGEQSNAFLNADEQSKNTIHVSKNKNYASTYGERPIVYFFGQQRQLSPEEAQKIFEIQNGLEIPKDKEFATTFEINMPYDDWKKMKQDEKYVSLVQNQLNIDKKKAEFINKFGDKVYQGPVDIDRAAIIGNKEVNIEERKKYNKEQFKRYAKNHKGRIIGGAALGAGLTALGAYGAYKIIKNEKEAKKAYQSYKNKGGKKNYKEFKKIILKEFYDFAFDNYSYLVEDMGIILDESDYKILNSML